jgi:glycosyltransferase involved in cell wall biosynthesis
MESSIFEYSKVYQTENDKINLILTGRLVPFKNVISVIRALQYIPKSIDFRLTIIGSGSEKIKIDKEIISLNLSDKIRFIKEANREEVLSKLSRSDIYLFPSLREGGSWALMEAMAIGLPVICLKWSGMEIITDKSSAIQLPVSNPEQLTKDIAKAICKLIDNPSERQRMGNAARERIKIFFNWEAKGAFMEQLFIELENKKSNRK